MLEESLQDAVISYLPRRLKRGSTPNNPLSSTFHDKLVKLRHDLFHSGNLPAEKIV
jgi:hypothetical protein